MHIIVYTHRNGKTYTITDGDSTRPRRFWCEAEAREFAERLNDRNPAQHYRVEEE